MSGPSGFGLITQPTAAHQLQKAVVQHQQQKLKWAVVVAGGNDDPSMALPPVTHVTNFDRLMEAFTILIPSQNSSEVSASKLKQQEADSVPFYYFEDLCESLTMLSLYGLGVPLLLVNNQELVTQYYVPYLSGIQLYVDPLEPISHLGNPSEQNSSMNICLSSNKVGVPSSTGTLFFEYFEKERPWFRKPLNEQLEELADRVPKLKKCKSCQLLPSSWISLAWHPIYRIPIGPVLGDLEVSFLTYHSLSTQSTSEFPTLSGGASARNPNSAPKISLPVFGLASLKLKGSMLSPREPLECEQESSLWRAAESWLQHLNVRHPDFQFYRNQYYRP